MKGEVGWIGSCGPGGVRKVYRSGREVDALKGVDMDISRGNCWPSWDRRGRARRRC